MRCLQDHSPARRGRSSDELEGRWQMALFKKMLRLAWDVILTDSAEALRRKQPPPANYPHVALLWWKCKVEFFRRGVCGCSPGASHIVMPKGKNSMPNGAALITKTAKIEPIGCQSETMDLQKGIWGRGAAKV